MEYVTIPAQAEYKKINIWFVLYHMEEVTIPTQSEQKDKDKPCTIWRKIQIPEHGEQKDEGVVCTIWSML